MPTPAFTSAVLLTRRTSEVIRAEATLCDPSLHSHARFRAHPANARISAAVLPTFFQLRRSTAKSRSCSSVLVRRRLRSLWDFWFRVVAPQQKRHPVAETMSPRHANKPNQAMQLTASKPDVHAWSVCRRERMLRFMHRGLAAADLVSR